MIDVGTVIGGRLRIDSVLGAGGMGVVAAATHLELGHRVAVKVMRDELAQSSTIVERFIREARAVVQLQTEHVCRVLDVGRLDSGAPYIMMELLEGADLARAIAQRPLPVAIAVEYIVQACVALAEAHALGIVHRDLKPANLFVTRRRDGGPLVKVLDFGIAKAVTQGAALTHGSGILGSPGFMSPEQIQSAHEVDARSDIWALGVTLYQLVSGRLPFFATTPMDVALKIATEPPAALEVDPALAQVILRCLEKDPARRYPDVRALVADLVRFGGQGAARAATELAPAQPYVPPPVSQVSATAATAPGTTAPVSVTPRPTSVPGTTAPAPSRAWIWLVAATLLAAGAVVIALVVTRSHTPPSAARDAAVVAHVPAADATVVAITAPAPDAATLADAPSPPLDAPLPPHDARTKPMTAQETQRMIAAAQLQAMQQADNALADCRKKLADPAQGPYVKAYCACTVHDAALAQATLPQVTMYRESIVSWCAYNGIKLK